MDAILRGAPAVAYFENAPGPSTKIVSYDCDEGLSPEMAEYRVPVD